MELSAAPPAIFLVDIDAFFAQVEQILQPELKGRPVIVGGLVTDRSVVASASYEARARGVKTAMPLAQAHRICPDAVFLRGNFHAYARFSREMMDLCRRYTPLVEPMSLDEAYLDVTGCRRLFETQGIISAGDAWPLEAADHLKRTLKREMDLFVTVGVAASRLVAKIACDYAKPNGVAYVKPGYEAPFLAPLPLKVLPGIGPRTAERLARYNLHQVCDLVRIPPAMLAAHFGPAAEVLAARARGIDSSTVNADLGDPKSISRETTFETNLIARDAMLAMLYYLMERACRQLRDDGLLARTVTVKVRYADFLTEGRSRSLPTFSDHDALALRAERAADGPLRRNGVPAAVGVLSLGRRYPQAVRLQRAGDRAVDRTPRNARARLERLQAAHRLPVAVKVSDGPHRCGRHTLCAVAAATAHRRNFRAV
jgi:DNA polymerase-4